MVRIGDVLERERSAVAAHRESLRSGSFPAPSVAPKQTFLHGFLLPFSIFVATLRSRELGRPYLKIMAARLVVVVALTSFAWSTGSASTPKEHKTPTVVIHHDKHKTNPSASASDGVHVNLPGVHVDINEAPGAKSEVRVLGQNVPVEEVDDRPVGEKKEAKKEESFLASGWARLLAVFALVSSMTAVVIALSRRYDDWLGFGISALAGIRPEDEKRKEPKIALDLKWLFKKLKERIRESIVFAAGMPVIALFLLVPSLGDWLFKIVSFLWGYYWVGVFTAAKTDHALIDAKTAPPPLVIRGLNGIAGTHWWTAPLRWYGRLWVWLTKSFNSPAAAFERSPAAFLGLALARAFLSLPGLYMLAKPIVPVAAGRLCAEADPFGRLTSTPASGFVAESVERAA
jgi:hypothetical protein